ncbi:hypothetical protein DPX39_010040300 [Trypanosoma brucei equiperdum]|uniref:Uncharacterized protein n=1 Tax=Trypanosoma brucei equiperdum TaxID=630700 RepID=A0A3L6LFE9_9TRYP|nr:hypothetical protein DPX39_010040300 [Trypanosoma brucei equiperdum]
MRHFITALVIIIIIINAIVIAHLMPFYCFIMSLHSYHIISLLFSLFSFLSSSTLLLLFVYMYCINITLGYSLSVQLHFFF